MGVLGTATVSTLGVIGTAAYLIRRRISRNWIDCRSKPCDLIGKTIIITGGNVGLGYETAKDLVRRNANVVLACRNVESGQEAAKAITNDKSNVVDVMELDLSSLASVRSFSSLVTKKYPQKIDALICNAGVWVPMDQHAKTKDGFEIHFGVNHLGHFELIQKLQPQMKENGRVILVSSSLMKSGKLNMETKDFVREGRTVDNSDTEQQKKSFAPTGYCDSKLMNALTAKQLSKTTTTSTSVVAVTPGFCRSSLGRYVDFAWYKKALITPIMRLIQRTTVQGAQNIIFCVIEPTLENGAFYSDGEIGEAETEYMESLGEAVPQQLLELSHDLIKGSEK